MAVRYILADGERRWRAAQTAGVNELTAIVLDHKPSAGELAILQASIDIHRASLKPTERAALAAKIQRETGKSGADLAAMLNISPSLVSKLLSFSKLAPPIQAMLDAGTLDGEKAYMLASEEHARQLELVKDAGKLSRDQLRARVKARPESQIKTCVARFPIAAATTVTVTGKEMTLAGAIDALSDVLKELKRGQAQGIEIDAMQKVLKDKAKAGK